LFRRSKPETTTAATSGPTSTNPPKEGGKGRPTPTRREAEAAARARAKAPRTRKELAAAQRKQRAESSRSMRQALKSGDERYYPARDRGPVRRFVRDFVDVRFSLLEVMMPILLVVLVLGYTGQPQLVSISNTLLLVTVLFLVVDALRLRFALRREVGRRFPEESQRGLTYYALVRSAQMRFMRLPKPQVRIGQQLPERYR
jgi:hypothetical protein